MTDEAPPERDDRVESRRARLSVEVWEEAKERRELELSREDVERFVEKAPARYLLGFSTRRMTRHVAMWRDVSRYGGLAVHVSHLVREHTTRLTIVCPDRPGLLALLAGTLAANGLQILSAEGFSIEAAQGPSTASRPSELAREHDLIGLDSGRTDATSGRGRPVCHRRDGRPV
ncbi:MAG: hypothetical protein HC923_02505 [Myxococcales bacterium]|nr:hypothetical protein [Myxococcales bacterium]